MRNADHSFLIRCIGLAQMGGTGVRTNPMVGAVVVYKGKIIGEGYHQSLGGPHAEVNAIQSVTDKSLLASSTLYVSLEPCCFHGKTPPCTDLIIAHRIEKVVIGCLDPNPLVAGQGVARLREHGVNVTIADDPQTFQALNKVFFFNQQQQRPYISLKWAQSQDGFIAGLDSSGHAVSTKISDYPAAVFTHRLRAEHQAILVGLNTANIDNPRLNTRLYPGLSPQAIVLGRAKKLKPNLHLLQRENHIVSMPQAEQTLTSWLSQLYKDQHIASILVEGGSHVLQQFIEANCFESLYRYRSPKVLVQGVKAPVLAEDFPWSGNAQLGPDRLDWYHRPL